MPKLYEHNTLARSIKKKKYSTSAAVDVYSNRSLDRVVLFEVYFVPKIIAFEIKKKNHSVRNCCSSIFLRVDYRNSIFTHSKENVCSTLNTKKLSRVRLVKNVFFFFQFFDCFSSHTFRDYRKKSKILVITASAHR